MHILCIQFTSSSGLQQLIKTTELKPEMLFYVLITVLVGSPSFLACVRF